MKFEKVTLSQFIEDTIKLMPWIDDDTIELAWNNLKLPQRATSGSAGYDFYAPYTIALADQSPLAVPTGIRALIDHGKFLMIVPRSGLGFKHGLSLSNTSGVIDEDYSYAANEGHIITKLYKRTEGILRIEQGERFVQGIFMPYCIIDDDTASTTRVGGMGSTGTN